MFKYRVISFPLLLALLAAIIFWPAGGPYLYAFTVPIAVGMVLFEVCIMIKEIGLNTFPKLTATLGGLLFLELILFKVVVQFAEFAISNAILKSLVITIIIALIGSWFILFLSKDRKAVISKLLTSIGVLILISSSLLSVALVYFNSIDQEVSFYIGSRELLFLILVTKAMDTGGYIFGKLSSYLPGGNHKILPSVSPKKSWEGTIGGMIMSIGVSLIFWYIYSKEADSFATISIFDNSLSWFVFAGIILSIGSLAGDLTESALKRTCKVKDSGHIILGMGGVFDVMDSFIYNGFIFWIIGILSW